jgi:hypothetical protein
MDMRDRARSDLYLAQLRSQSAPNTPGFGPKSPALSQYAMSPRFPPSTYKSLSDITEAPVFTPGAQVVQPPPSTFAAQSNSPQPAEKPFKLQAPPSKARSATPKIGQGAFHSPTTTSAPEVNFPTAAPGEQQYDAVPIPGAYADAVVKSLPPAQTSFRR